MQAGALLAPAEEIVPTAEIGEIHAIALELLAWPFYGKLFTDDAIRYRSHLLRSLITPLPYIAAIDPRSWSTLRRPRRPMTAVKCGSKWNDTTCRGKAQAASARLKEGPGGSANATCTHSLSTTSIMA
jgi:hypothetical protein